MVSSSEKIIKVIKSALLKVSQNNNHMSTNAKIGAHQIFQYLEQSQ